MLHKSIISNSIKHRKSGFSLVEVMMQMLLIATITTPLVMMLHSQQLQVETGKKDTQTSLVAKELFDNVILQHPDPIDTFSVSQNTSIYCDTATRLKDNSTVFNEACGASGTDLKRGPFFRRSLSWVNQNNLKVTVSLYRGSTDTTPYYQDNREYNMDTFRINFGELSSAISNSFASINSFGQKSLPDSAGQIWASFYSVATLSNNDSNNSWFITNSSCTLPSPSTLSGNEFPFNSYMSLTNCTTGITAYFPNMTSGDYDVNLYFAPPSTGATTACISGTQGVSCNLADVSILKASSTIATDTTLQDIANLDLYVNNGSTTDGKGYVFHTTVKLDQPVLKILIKSYNSDATVPLSGIEVVRRTDSL